MEENWDSTQKPLHAKRTEFNMKMESLEVYLFSLPVKESVITDFFLGASPPPKKRGSSKAHATIEASLGRLGSRPGPRLLSLLGTMAMLILLLNALRR